MQICREPWHKNCAQNGFGRKKMANVTAQYLSYSYKPVIPTATTEFGLGSVGSETFCWHSCSSLLGCHSDERSRENLVEPSVGQH